MRALTVRAVVVIGACALLAGPGAQAGLVPAVGADDGELTRALPAAANAWAWLSLSEPAAILDRIDGAGLHPGEPARFSLRGSSWTQNAFALDGVDVTDPLRGGTPLLDPDVVALDRIDVVSARAPVEQAAPGAALGLVPREPGPAWQGSVAAAGADEGLQAGTPAGDVPAVARFGSLAEASVATSGPIGQRLSLLVAGRGSRSRLFERDDPAELEARVLSGTSELVFRPDERQSLRVLVAGQALRRPFGGRALYFAGGREENVRTLGALARYAREGGGTRLAARAGYWEGRFTPDTDGADAGRPVERVSDGPVPELVLPRRSDRGTASASAELALRPARAFGFAHALRLGLSAARASTHEAPGAALTIPETVAGQPARAWAYGWGPGDSRRHATDLAAWAADEAALADRLTLAAGLRLEASRGSASGAASDVSWTSLSPRVLARLRIVGDGRLVATFGYAEYRHRLLLAPLAFGDPNAARADVYRWHDANGDGRYQPSERGVLVGRVGPGAAADGLTAVDPALKPPRTREFTAGLEASLGGGFRLRLDGFDRRERDLLESVDVGVTAADYSVRYLQDPSGDILGTQDDQLLPVYDRKPDSFGRDRYLLTNPPGLGSLHRGVELRLDRPVGERLRLRFGGTASMTEISGASRGFHATENDQALVAELFDDPNADTYARGRSFFDRAFTLLLAAAYRAPAGFRFAVAARYQDGQPFARLVVVNDLAQGPEAISATPRGQVTGAGTTDAAGRYLVASGHRFSYTLTVDARVEKALALGAVRLALLLDVFNLLGSAKEVEEDPVWGNHFREPTALQPPRALRLGARLDF
jgi:hypothetical protein